MKFFELTLKKVYLNMATGRCQGEHTITLDMFLLQLTNLQYLSHWKLEVS